MDTIPFSHSPGNGKYPLADDHQQLIHAAVAAQQHAAQADADTNARILKDERPVEEPYPVPDSLWQGVFAEVAKTLKRFTWEVWLGTFAALCAKARRNLHCHYFSDHIYGNNYALLINRTAAGKNLVVNITRALLGSTYKIRNGVQSGPGLVPLLTDDSLKATEGRLEVRGVPVLLLCSEWSRIAQMSGIQNATLQEDLNDVFMRHYPWSLTRSHKSNSGGDIIITDPTLTVAGTTTRTLFAQVVTDKALGNGTINRYLIVPGTAVWEEYDGQSYHPEKSCAGLLDRLGGHAFGFGAEIKTLYSPEAWSVFRAFQTDVIAPLQRDETGTPALKRLDVHYHHVAALYAWQTQAKRIELAHVQAAQAVVETSKAFVEELLEERACTFELTKQQAADEGMEKRVLTTVKQFPGLTRREFSRKVANDKGGYTAWMKTLEALLKAEALTTKRNGKREELFVEKGA